MAEDSASIRFFATSLIASLRNLPPFRFKLGPLDIEARPCLDVTSGKGRRTNPLTTVRFDLSMASATHTLGSRSFLVSLESVPKKNTTRKTDHLRVRANKDTASALDWDLMSTGCWTTENGRRCLYAPIEMSEPGIGPWTAWIFWWLSDKGFVLKDYYLRLGLSVESAAIGRNLITLALLKQHVRDRKHEIPPLSDELPPSWKLDRSSNILGVFQHYGTQKPHLKFNLQAATPLRRETFDVLVAGRRVTMSGEKKGSDFRINNDQCWGALSGLAEVQQVLGLKAPNPIVLIRRDDSTFEMTNAISWRHTVSSDTATSNGGQPGEQKMPLFEDVTAPSDGAGNGSDEPPEPRYTDSQLNYEEPDLSTIAERIRQMGMDLDEDVLRRYHLALRMGGIVVLAGDSGVGKTWIATAYAKAVNGKPKLIPVAPNWTTNEDLLGYLSPVSLTYQDTEFSRLVKEASKEYRAATSRSTRPRPYFAILDEMNLARVEYYMAKLLSALPERQRHPDGTTEVELVPGMKETLTPNLYIIGTVNMDETTHGFAPKVFDRAQVIDVTVSRERVQLRLDHKPYQDLVMRIWDAVHEVCPFSLRTVEEIKRYIGTAEKINVLWEEALDDQILQKIIPRFSRLAGDDLRKPLDRLIELSKDCLPRTHAKCVSVRERLKNELPPFF